MRNPPPAAVLVALVAAALACAPDAPVPVVMDSSVIVGADGLVPALVCPGATGCASAAGVLRVGAAARTVTPVVNEGAPPVWLAGFTLGRQATGVHDDVWARALVIEQGDVRAALVVVDALGLFHHDTVRVRTKAKELGIDHIIVTSTHVHESKDTMGMWGEQVGVTAYDEEYMELIASKATEALAEAVSELVEVTMTVGLSSAAQYVRDSRQPIVLDQSLHAVHFESAAGPVATLVVWGNHPETLDDTNTLLTSDYPHYVRDEVEARLPGTTAVFASGILGGLTTTLGLLVCPDEAGLDTCPQGTFERAEVVGRFVGAAAVDSLLAPEARDESFADDALAIRRHPLLFTPTNQPLAIAFQLGMLQRPLYDQQTGERIPDEQVPGLTLDEIASGLVQIDSEVSAVSIGGVELLTVPGELYAELWLAKEDGTPLIERPDGADHPDAPFEQPISTIMRNAKTKIVLNNANDAIGYILPEAQFDFTSPYAYNPDSGQYGEQNSIGHLAGPELVDGISALYELTLR